MAKEFTYKVNLDAETGQLTNKLKIVNDQLANLGKSGAEPGIGKSLLALNERLDELKSKTSTPIRTMAAFGPMEKDLSKIGQTIQHLIVDFEALKREGGNKKLNVLPPNTSKNILTAAKALDTYNSAIERSGKATDTYTKAQKRKLDLESRYADLVAKIKAVEEARDEAAIKKTEAEKNRDAAKVGGNPEEIETTSQAYRTASSQVTSYNKSLADLRTQQTKLANDVKTATTEFEAQAQVWRNSKTSQQVTAFQNLVAVAREVGVSFENLEVKQDGFLKRTPANIQELKARLQELVDGGMVQADAQIDEINRSLLEMNATVETSTKGIEREAQAFREQNEAAGEVQGILSRIKQFTGLTGAALIMRRSLQSAFNTIKELDKQMTEMAVVTDLGVSDYWNQLPEHTERANELGLAIKDVYEAETLYYQQGLKAAEVTALSTSTLKMARIAGLSAEDATNKMTAALRGFNMELNQTNGDRIADVYSKLAAITASDVEEISTAMTKTASIASNAGMEFETTAAFLAQIIETTRESAETAGTAMKTVIARFQELKKAPEEIGEVDGEIVDANKIETALRTVGVALRDSEGQFRKLDEVFIDLASKWDTLDMNTQRYIATIAAGSRQQSRFVAMMSNYARTQELVNAANMAAGASNEQFEKTLDSLQSKLAALKNAWDTFTMGLANNEFIKGAVQALTSFMDLINKVTSGFDSWSSSILKIGVVTGALIAGDKALKIFTTSLGNGKTVLQSFGSIFTKTGDSIKTLSMRLKTVPSRAVRAAKSTNVYKTASADLLNTQTQLKTAQLRLNVATKTCNDLAAAGATTGKKFAAAQDELDKATASVAYRQEQATAAQIAMGTAVGFNEKEMEAYTSILELSNTVTGQGITEEQMLILTKAGLNAENIKLYATTHSCTEAEAAAALAAKYGNVTGLKSILIKKSEAATNFLVKIGLGGLVQNRVADTAATEGQTAANISLMATLWPLLAITLVLAAAILAIAAVVWVMVKAFKAVKAESPAGQFDAATASLENATEAANAAAEAYENLKDSFSALTEKYDALDQLTVGTLEWRKALLEVNSEVLKLIELYPALAQGVTVSEYGVLQLDADTMRLAELTAQKTVAQTMSAQLDATIKRNQAQAKLDYSNLSWAAVAGSQTSTIHKGVATGVLTGGVPLLGALGQFADSLRQDGVDFGHNVLDYFVSFYGGPIGAGIMQGLRNERSSRNANEDITSALARAVAKGDLQIYDAEGAINKDTLAEWMRTNGLTDESEINNWIKALGKDANAAAKELEAYGLALEQLDIANKVAIQGMIDNATTMVDTTKYTQEQITMMNNIGTDLMNRLKQEAEQETKIQGRGLQHNASYKAYWESIYGVGNVKITGRGKVETKNDQGEWEQKVSKEDAQASYSAAKATEHMASVQEQLIKALGNGRNALGRAYKNAEGGSLTQRDVNKLTTEELNTIWEDNEALQQLYTDFDEFNKEITYRTTIARNAFTKNKRTLKNLGLEDLSLLDNMTADIQTGLVSHLSQIVAVSGQEAATVVNDAFKTMMQNVAAENREMVENTILSINWHDTAALEDLPNIFKEIGIYVPQKELQAFIEETKEAAQAIRNVDLEKLTESLTKLGKTLSEIRTNDQGRTFEKDTYEALIAVNSDLKRYFKQDLEGNFIYLGSSMATLTEAVHKNTDALLAEKQETLSNSYNARVLLDQLANTKIGNIIGDISNWTQWTAKQQQRFLEEFITLANEQGYRLKGINDYLGNNPNTVKTLSGDKIDSIFTSLLGLGSLTEIAKELRNAGVQAQISSMLANNTYNSRVTSELTTKVAMGQATPAEQSEYIAARTQAVMRAENLNISEQDKASVIALTNALEKLEDTYGDTVQTVWEYRKQVTMLHDELRKLNEKSSYQTMYEGMKQNLEEANELFEEYQSINDEKEKELLLNRILAEFNLVATEDMKDTYAASVEAMLFGNEQGLANLANFAGVAAGIGTNAYKNMEGQVMSSFNTLEEAFAQSMINAKYAWVDAENRFHWGINALIDSAKKLGKEMSKWYSPYDWLWNETKNVNALLKERERYEREWTQAIEDNSKDVNELAKNLESQINLTAEIATRQSHIATNAAKEIEDIYANVQSNPILKPLQDIMAIGANGRIVVNKDKLYQAGLNAEAGSEVENYIGKLEELLDTVDSAKEAAWEAEDTWRELRKTGQEQYNTLIDRATEALRTIYQEEIDTLSDINDTISDAASALVDKIQEKIDDDRQARDNAKTEQALRDKQAQLAYLQASGGNQVEILKLQHDIADNQESYTDTLVDQAIDELQKTNERAADQRQEQIDIAQAQYDWWSEHDAIHEAEQLVDGSLQQIANGVDPINSNVGKLLSGPDNVAAQTKEGMKTWHNELASQGNLATIYKSITSNTGLNYQLDQTRQALSTGTDSVKASVNSIQSALTKLTVGDQAMFTPDAYSKLTHTNLLDAKNITDAYVNALSKLNEHTTVGDPGEIPKSDGTDATGPKVQTYEPTSPKLTVTDLEEKYKTTSSEPTEVYNGPTRFFIGNKYTTKTVDGVEWIEFPNADLEGSAWYRVEDLKKVLGMWVLKAGTDMMQFTTGGLANFTGPAWMDGTTAAPELVLNATDTANFIELKNLLADAFKDGQSTTSLGNNYYDIDVHVDNIDSDYDIDSAAAHMKELIEAEAMYRNVNAIQRTR